MTTFKYTLGSAYANSSIPSFLDHFPFPKQRELQIEPWGTLMIWFSLRIFGLAQPLNFLILTHQRYTNDIVHVVGMQEGNKCGTQIYLPNQFTRGQRELPMTRDLRHFTRD